MTDAPAPQAKCGCLECRVRQSLYGGEINAPFEIDTNEAIKALGNVLAELLAHHSSKAAKHFAAALLDHRKRWLKYPRVAAQQPPAGHA
jgi:hypothetical protein